MAQPCTPAQDRAAAKAEAKRAVRRALGTAALLWKARYDDVGYDLRANSPQVLNTLARVRGTLTLRGTLRSTGEQVAGTYSGEVVLKRLGPCEWKATSYRRLH